MSDMMDIKTAQARVAQLEHENAHLDQKARELLHNSILNEEHVKELRAQNARLLEVLRALVVRIDSKGSVLTPSSSLWPPPASLLEPELTAARAALAAS